ncbi:hypothetical protein C8C83_5428 [Flavobacterium sp. 90]|uniref:hypothetical protein n=1 Tax=unclassified Flavobacterium TaxID=196869 RepID=UPI000EB1EAED|nr:MULTISPECIES: hypothetical protein [unclassified Flavobacterium]RKR08193.1 hypothetical protein C8C82_0055 [Flavobacterium sp. 81]TCK57384.1 hypothetical protein C8C83_5428 [Flavobacterium sp. 90]
MFNRPIDNSIRSEVVGSLKAATKKAEKYYNENITSKIEGLDIFESLKIIDQEFKLVKRKIKKSKYPFYTENCTSADWLVSQFASRAYLLNIDETKDLKKAVFLGIYRNKLRAQRNELLAESPAYTYEKFVNGEINSFFHHYPQYRNLSEEDFYKIIKWQSEKVIAIISYESSMLIEKIQQHCLEIDDPFFFIMMQKTIIKNLMDYTGNDPNDLKILLSQLYIFEDFNLEEFENDALLENYRSFANNEFHWNKADYNSIKNLSDVMQGGPKKVFTNEFLVFHTIEKIGFWLGTLVNESRIQQPYILPDYEKELEKVQREAAQEIENLADAMYNYINDEENSEKEVKNYLLKLYDANRIRYNKIKEKDILHMLADDRQHVLINYFTTNAFFRNNIGETAENLKELIIVRELAWEILVAHNNFFDNKNIFITLDNDFSDINMLINKMVLNKKLYKAGKKAQMDFFSNYDKYSVPIDYHFQNVHEELKKVFTIALNKLQKILDNAEPSKKVLYLQSRIKEIKQRELLFKQYQDESDFKYAVDKYSVLFKEFLTIEADFLRETFNAPPEVLEVKQKHLLEIKPEFGTITNKRNQKFIMQLLEDLGLTIDGKANISERKKGAVRGIVEALKQNKILPDKSLEILCKIIGDKIGLPINSKLDVSNISEQYKKEAEKYISENYNS